MSKFCAPSSGLSGSEYLILFKVKLFQEAMFFIIILTSLRPEVNIQVQNDHGVLSSLVSCIKSITTEMLLCMEPVCKVLHGHFGPVYLLQGSTVQNDNKNRCSLK